MSPLTYRNSAVDITPVYSNFFSYSQKDGFARLKLGFGEEGVVHFHTVVAMTVADMKELAAVIIRLNMEVPDEIVPNVPSVPQEPVPGCGTKPGDPVLETRAVETEVVRPSFQRRHKRRERFPGSKED